MFAALRPPDSQKHPAFALGIAAALGIEIQNVSAMKKTGSLWKCLAKAGIGALVVGLVAITFVNGWVTFNTLPRLSAAAICIGVVAFIYMSIGFGKAIAAVEGLRSTRAQQAVPTDRAKPRSG